MISMGCSCKISLKPINWLDDLWRIWPLDHPKSTFWLLKTHILRGETSVDLIINRDEMPWANQWTMDLDVIWIQEWRCAKPICGDWTDHEKYGFCCEQWIWMRLKMVELAKVVMFNEKHDDKALSLTEAWSKNCKYNQRNGLTNLEMIHWKNGSNSEF